MISIIFIASYSRLKIEVQKTDLLGFKGFNATISHVTRVKLRRNKVDKTVTMDTSGRR